MKKIVGNINGINSVLKLKNLNSDKNSDSFSDAQTLMFIEFQQNSDIFQTFLFARYFYSKWFMSVTLLRQKNYSGCVWFAWPMSKFF